MDLERMNITRYVSYTRSASNNAYCDLSYYKGATEGTAALKLQAEHIHSYADSHGIKLMAAYTDTGDGSAFRSLVTDGMERKFDGVIVDSIDRCGPSLWDAKEVLLETFQYAGIHFIVVQEDFDSSVGNETAEGYFQGKYSEWKRGHMRTLDFSRHWNRPDPENSANPEKADGCEVKEKSHKRNTAHSPLTGLVYDAESGKPFRMKTIDGTQYFLRSRYSPKRTEGHSLTKEEMESLVMDALDAEKAQAEKILERLKNGDGKDILDYRLSLVGAQMRQLFDRQAEMEFAEVDFTRAYENGEITEEEYHLRRAAQQDALLEADKDFQEAEDAGDRLEKGFGLVNPWIALMQSWERPEKLTRATVKKYIEKAAVRDFRTATVTTKMDEWKKLLPVEWLL